MRSWETEERLVVFEFQLTAVPRHLHPPLSQLPDSPQINSHLSILVETEFLSLATETPGSLISSFGNCLLMFVLISPLSISSFWLVLMTVSFMVLSDEVGK